MNDKEMKSLLKNAYQITPSDKEKAFIRKHEKRSIRLWDVFVLEFKYMGFASVLTGFLLLSVFFILFKSNVPMLMWCISAILPVSSLLLLSGLGMSERHGMHELEASSRFSLKFIRTVRMFIIGAVTLVVLIASCCMLSSLNITGMATIIGIIGTPYMVSVWGNLLITRKWHDKENILGCLAVTAASCLLPVVMNNSAHILEIKPALVMAVMLLSTVFAVRESILYIRESEDLAWNF